MLKTLLGTELTELNLEIKTLSKIIIFQQEVTGKCIKSEKNQIVDTFLFPPPIGFWDIYMEVREGTLT